MRLLQGWMEGLTQFQNQLLAVDKPTPRERMGNGKISPTITHADGPQVIANMEIIDANECDHGRNSWVVIF